jgi:hypothetical protein
MLLRVELNTKLDLPKQYTNVVCVCSSYAKKQKITYIYVDIVEEELKENFVIELFENCESVKSVDVVNLFFSANIVKTHFLLRGGGNSSINIPIEKQKLISSVQKYEKYLDPEGFYIHVTCNF